MSKIKVVTPSGKGGKDVELPAEFFGAKVNIPLIHQVVVAQEGNSPNRDFANSPINFSVAPPHGSSGPKSVPFRLQ